MLTFKLIIVVQRTILSFYEAFLSGQHFVDVQSCSTCCPIWASDLYEIIHCN